MSAAYSGTDLTIHRMTRERTRERVFRNIASTMTQRELEHVAIKAGIKVRKLTMANPDAIRLGRLRPSPSMDYLRRAESLKFGAEKLYKMGQSRPFGRPDRVFQGRRIQGKHAL